MVRNVRRRVRRGRRNQNFSNNRQQQVPVRKWEINGRQLRPSPDPPANVLQPWNHATLNIGFQTTANEIYDLDVLTVYSRMVTQLGLAPSTGTGQKYEFRMQEVKIWNLSGSSVVLNVCDLIHPQSKASTRAITTIRDAAGRNQWARVGYVWPRSHQAVTFIAPPTPGSDLDNYVLAYLTETADGTSFTIHFNILWRAVPFIPSLERKPIMEDSDLPLDEPMEVDDD